MDYDNDADAENVRDYLKTLLITLLEEGEGFSGKRPLGNSDWQFQLAHSLVKAKLIDGEVLDEEYGEFKFEWDDFNSAMAEGIHSL